MSSNTRAHIEVHPTGQAIGLVAGGASVQVAGDGSVVANQASAITKKGEEIKTATVEAGVATVNVEHAAWASVPASATSIAVTNDGTPGYVKEMHMTVQPAAAGLTVSGVVWEAGAAPVFAEDTKYIVRLRQIGSDVFGAVEASKPGMFAIPSGTTVDLQDGCVYTPTGGLTNWDLQSVTVAIGATAEIRFTQPADVQPEQAWAIAFPDEWVWSTGDEFDATLDPPVEVGDFTPGMRYCVVVRNDNGTVLANVATRLKTA